ncbi:MAG: pilus assembly protein [Spirochaetae bacterium HGW-Spirochaetae-5]|nr:MAG: pilus assembly protein [Spirochaetae bacterium HGW-Spirochaetae-5]
MIILDTSVWIEFLKNNPEYYSKVKDLLENRKVLAIECIFGELLQGAKSRREIEIISLYWENLPKAIIENGWIEAGKYSSINKLTSIGVGIIDSFIIVTARKLNASIWSLDKKLNSLLNKEEKYL